MYVYVYTVQAYQPVVQCHTCNKQYCTCDNGTSNNNYYYFVRFMYTVAIYRPDLRDTGSMVEMDTGSMMVVTDTGSMVVTDTGLMAVVLRACHSL